MNTEEIILKVLDDNLNHNNMVNDLEKEKIAREIIEQLTIPVVVGQSEQLPWWETQIKNLEDLQRELRQQIRDNH